MTDQSTIWTPLLLADPSACLRFLVLRELLGRPDEDPEVLELAAMRDQDPLVTDLLALQQTEGSWQAGDRAWAARGGRRRITPVALARLSYLGFGPDHPAVERAAEHLFSLQRKDGSWPLRGAAEAEVEREGYSMIPIQTALPLRALAACGYAADPRAERAFDWLLDQRLDDGAWPTGHVSGTLGGVAGYRRLAHSQWGCRSSTTAALACLALHPQRRTGPEAQRALDLLLGRETREQHTLGFEVARLIGAEEVRGTLTFHARFDLAQILDLAWRVGATLEDERLAEVAETVRDARGPYGMWEYASKPQASRWVTFDVLRSLSRLDDEGDWASLEPRTPFQVYPKKRKRY